MSQPPKTDLARVLWETCPKCYGQLDGDSHGLYCPQGHYQTGSPAVGPTDLNEADQRLIADGGTGE
jgi:hypothetical protein